MASPTQWHEFEQGPGDGGRQGNLACCSPWGHKETDVTDWLNNNIKFIYRFLYECKFLFLSSKYLWIELLGCVLSSICLILLETFKLFFTELAILFCMSTSDKSYRNSSDLMILSVSQDWGFFFWHPNSCLVRCTFF